MDPVRRGLYEMGKENKAPKKDERVKWYLRPTSVILSLFFVLGPFGLPLLYKSPKFSKTLKIVLPQMREKERHVSHRNVVQQWFCILSWLFLISSPSPYDGGKGRMGVDLLDLSPPPESSPTVGGGTIF